MRWSIAARFASFGEAAAARSALDAAGIQSYLADENLVAIDWLYAQALGSLKLMVAESDVERSREIIGTIAGTCHPERSERFLPQARGGSLAVYAARDDSPKCPECGSAKLRPIPRIRIFLLFSALFIGLGAVVGQPLFGLIALIGVVVGVLLMPSHRCLTCGHRWSPAPEERLIDAPLPDPADTVEEPCPRCGSLEVYQIDYRRLKAIPLLFNLAMFVVLPVWWLLPKRRCDSCGLELR